MKRKNSLNSETDSTIQVLKIIEAIQKNMGMYIGSKDIHGFHHLACELLENSADEASARAPFNTLVKVTLSHDQRTFIIEDNGRGIPTEINSSTGVSSLQTVFTFAHSGGKFDNGKDNKKTIYKTSGGMHGIGLTAVNALASKLEVWSRHNGKVGYILFEDGIVKKVDNSNYSDGSTGLIISFTPNVSRFDDVSHFDINIIRNRLEELSRLNRYLTFSFFHSPDSYPEVFHFDTGLLGWVKDINKDDFLINTEICDGKWEKPSNDINDYILLNFAFQYYKGDKTKIKSFCNSISTEDGGSHRDGFENGIASACQKFIKDKYSKKFNFEILKVDVLKGLTAIVSINMQGQIFSGQTKNKLVNANIRGIVKNATEKIIQDFFQDNISTAHGISEKIINNAKIRTRIEEDQILRKEVTQSSSLPSKLIDCISNIFSEREIYIVEGDSAGGSAKSAKEDNQAILTVKGKVINVEKKIAFKNEEIISLINAIGFSVSEIISNYYGRFYDYVYRNKELPDYISIEEDFVYEEEKDIQKIIPANTPLNIDQISLIVEETKKKMLSKLRYNKVIIMADADADGKHIECLLITFFVKYLRFIVEDNHLFLAVTPLYRIQNKKQTIYFYSDSELDEYRLENQKDYYTVQRFKGLGEMNPKQLRDTTMGNEKYLRSLSYSDPEKTHDIIDKLMGKDSSFRREILEDAQLNSINYQLIVIDFNIVKIFNILLAGFLLFVLEAIKRTIPNIEDGFKEVQRRIAYTLYILGLFPNKTYRKSSKLVGDVMSRYHPHGDSSIYQAMVKMAQNFSYRYPIIDGQGNWGSIDGDPAAAMRYTEVKLTSFGLYLLENYLPFEVVEMVDNYDGNEKEPKILPSTLNLLLNGSSGIAVGMNTNIPPHNLMELVDTTIRLIENSSLNNNDLFDTFNGPDFPTGGIILNSGDIRKIYEKGEGTFYLRAKTTIISSKDKDSSKKDTIIISQIPFKVVKSNLVHKINTLIKEKTIKGLRSVRDYSNFERPVDIRLTFDPFYDGEIILNKLFRLTDLQVSFSVKIRALLDEKPKIFSLKEIICHFITKNLENIKKKSLFLRNKNDKELISLKIRSLIISNYQEIINIIRNNLNDVDRSEKICEIFLDKIEELNISKNDFVNKILDTQASFRQFTPEKIKDLESRIFSIQENNSKLSLLIDNPEIRERKLIEELLELRKKYSFDLRRTVISEKSSVINDRETIPQENRLAIFSELKSKDESFNNYLSVYELSHLESTNIPSQGKLFKTRGENLFISSINRRNDIFLFSNYGRIYSLNFYKFFAVNRSTNLREEYGLKLGKDEHFTAFLSVSEEILNSPEEKKLFIITEKGKIKLLSFSNFKKIGNSGKNIFSFKKSFLEKCNKHQSLLEDHKKSDCCDKSRGIKVYSECSKFRKLQDDIKNCVNCVLKYEIEKDYIKKAIIFEEKESFGLEAIIERKRKSKVEDDENIWNVRTSLYVRIREKYCTSHQVSLLKHKSEASHDCGISCKDVRMIQKLISTCIDCQRSENFSRKLRSKIKCESVVDVLYIKNDDYKENNNFLRLLLMREDNSCLKKKWFFSKNNNNLGKTFVFKKTKECPDHWNKMKSIQDKIDDLSFDFKNDKEFLRKKILSFPISVERKKEILSSSVFSNYEKKVFFDEDVKNIDIVDNVELLNEQAILKYEDDLSEKNSHVNNILSGIKNEMNNLKNIKEEIRTCSSCIGKCNKHQSLLEDHKKSDCCDKSRGIKVYSECSKFRKLQDDIKSCVNCNTLKNRKKNVKIFNKLRKVFLFNKKQRYEMYLLAGDFVCWYKKNTLLSFIHEDKRKRLQIYKNNKLISDSVLLSSS